VCFYCWMQHWFHQLPSLWLQFPNTSNIDTTLSVSSKSFHQHLQTHLYASGWVQSTQKIFIGTGWYTPRLLHTFGQLGDLTIQGFWSHYSNQRPEYPSDKTTFRWSRNIMHRCKSLKLLNSWRVKSPTCMSLGISYTWYVMNETSTTPTSFE